MLLGGETLLLHVRARERNESVVTEHPSPWPRQESEGVDGNPFPQDFFDQADPSPDSAFYSGLAWSPTSTTMPSRPSVPSMTILGSPATCWI